MDGRSYNLATGGSGDFRSFAVEVFAGRRASGWPFSRFEVSDRELRVRLSFPWSATRSQEAAATRAVVVTRRFGGMCCTRIDVAAGNFGDVHVHPLYHRQQIIDELCRCGYHVIGDTASAETRWRRRRS